MRKKGQITYFLLFAIIIVIAAGFIFYLINSKKAEDVKTPLDVQPLRQFVESCVRDVGKDAVVFISEHGGYYNLPNPYYSAFSLDIPYYFYQNIPFNPTKEQVEKQLSDYMNDNLFFCLRNFVDFRKLGYDLEIGDIKTKTGIVPAKVVFDLNIPIKLKRENIISNLETFRVELENIGIDKIINVNSLILKEQAKNPNSVCLSCILNWTINFDLQARLNRLEQNLILFTIIDNNTLINQNPLEFNFVNKYETFSCSNLPLDDVNFIGIFSSKINLFKIILVFVLISPNSTAYPNFLKSAKFLKQKNIFSFM